MKCRPSVMMKAKAAKSKPETFLSIQNHLKTRKALGFSRFSLACVDLAGGAA